MSCITRSSIGFFATCYSFTQFNEQINLRSEDEIEKKRDFIKISSKNSSKQGYDLSQILYTAPEWVNWSAY